MPNRLRGGEGADSLDGLGGVDALEGGDGNDVLRSVDLGVVDDDLCGSGVDSVYADAIDTVAADCEAVQRVIPPLDQPPPAGGGGDTTAPSLTGFALSRAAFTAASRGASARPATKHRARVGTKVRYTVSEDATVRFGVERRRAGRIVRLRGGFNRSAKRGQNRFKFTGRLSGRKLKPGRYYLVARARDGSGNQAAVKRVKFKIVKR